MARWQVESGVAHGRGFSQQDADGLLAKLTNFMKRPAADGGTQTFTADAGTNNITCSGHGYVDGESVSFSTTGTLPSPLLASTEYFVIWVDVNTFQIAETYSDAMDGNDIDITTAGSGTHSVYALGGGAGWYVYDDLSDVTAIDFATTDVNTSTEEITITGHSLNTGRQIVFSTTGTLPAGLTAGTTYYAIYSTANEIKVASSYSNAYAGTAINLSSQGSGTHTLTPRDPAIVFCDTDSPTVNDIDTGPSGLPPRFLKIMMPTATAGYVYVFFGLWHDLTTHFTAGRWAGYRMETSDDADFIYNARGGDEGFVFHDLIGTTWHEIGLDELVGDSNLVEGTSIYGVLQSGITAGSDVVLQLDTGQAANFTEGKYYYLYDFSAINSTAGRPESWVQYVLVTDVDTGTDQITLESASYNFSSGSVIAAYAHRFVAYGDGSATNITNINNSLQKIPYSSHYNSGTAGYSFHNQNGTIYGAAAVTFSSGYLTSMNPDDEGRQAVQRPGVYEVYMENNYTLSSTGQNRGYGTIKNTYLGNVNSMSRGMSGLVINGSNYIYFKLSSEVLGYGDSTRAVLVLDTESTT
jgi:hypothetical protein